MGGWERSKRQQAKLNTLKDEVREYRALQEIAANSATSPQISARRNPHFVALKSPEIHYHPSPPDGIPRCMLHAAPPLPRHMDVHSARGQPILTPWGVRRHCTLPPYGLCRCGGCPISAGPSSETAASRWGRCTRKEREPQPQR